MYWTTHSALFEGMGSGKKTNSATGIHCCCACDPESRTFKWDNIHTQRYTVGHKHWQSSNGTSGFMPWEHGLAVCAITSARFRVVRDRPNARAATERIVCLFGEPQLL